MATNKIQKIFIRGILAGTTTTRKDLTKCEGFHKPLPNGFNFSALPKGIKVIPAESILISQETAVA